MLLFTSCFSRGTRASLYWIRSMNSASTTKLGGRVAVVTASTDGIGYAIVNRLVQDGAKVIVSSRKQSNVDKAVASLRSEHGSERVAGIVCHVGKDEDRKQLIQKAIDTYGGIDILVSNAAVNPTFGPTLETPESAWDKIFSINVKATAMLVKAAHPHLKVGRNPCVVIVSSIGGYQPFNLLGPYSVSKTALLGLNRVLAEELAVDNIRVNCIAPGLIKTNFSSAIWKNEEAASEFTNRIPLKRLGEPDDCSGLVSFLCSDAAEYITGESVCVTGGLPNRL